ncbi:GNAT family N-acetyltransferase [Marinitenerispora sediminis]|uniref:GNAT family N-acetyltransferase n=1 Tax=Marinitenerispora sediminis TaxID=1931232 RepID=UPI0018F1C68D|nr:GNAT family N-acetyltransferase [Marinitenerispora sediminis]
MTEHVARATEDIIAEFWALGGETRVINGARLIRNREVPLVGRWNVITGLVGDDSDQFRRMLAEALDWIGAPAARVYAGPAMSRVTEAALLFAGWRPRTTMVEMVVAGPLAPPRRTPDPVAVRPVEDDADWDMLHALLRLGHEEEDRAEGHPPRPEEYTRQSLRAHRMRSAYVNYWLARVAGEDCGFFSSWPRPEGMAVVEDLYVRADRRGRGVGSQLLRHAVADARSAGADPVLVRADAADWPKDFYHRRGFRPAAVARYYELAAERG